MTRFDPDRLLKRVWLVLGLLLLPLVLAGLFTIGKEISAGWLEPRRTAIAAPTDSAAPRRDGPPRAVRFDLPMAIRGTGAQLAIVRHGAAFEPERRLAASARAASYYDQDSEGPIVNVAILPSGGTPNRLVFDRPVYIRQVAYPGERYSSTDSLQTWITYEVAEHDTDGNRQLDGRDNMTLYLSGLDGANLRRVLPEGWLLREYRTQGDHRSIVVTALQDPAPGAQDWKLEKAPQRAFVYDVATAQLQPFGALDSLAARAGLLLAAPRKR